MTHERVFDALVGHFDAFLPFGRFSVDDRRNRIKKNRFSMKTGQCGQVKTERSR